MIPLPGQSVAEKALFVHIFRHRKILIPFVVIGGTHPLRMITFADLQENAKMYDFYKKISILNGDHRLYHPP